ncbi:MAG: DUF2207 domain-containing protein [Bacilli bacterium]
MKNINTENIILAIILIIIFGIGMYFYNKTKNIKKLYCRQIPNIPLAMLSYYDKGKISDKTIWYTILDLTARKYYKIEKQGTTYFLEWQKEHFFELDSYDLKKFEKTLAKFINSIIVEDHNRIDLNLLQDKMQFNMTFPKMINKFYQEYKNEIKNNYGFLNKTLNLFLAVLLISCYVALIIEVNVKDDIYFAIGYAGLILGISGVLKNIKFNFKGLINIFLIIYLILIIVLPFVFSSSGLMPILILMNPLLIICVIYILQSRFYNSKQKELYYQIEGLKYFLNDFSILNKQDLEFISIYDKYYAVACILDIKLTKNPYNNVAYDDDSFETIDAIELINKIVASHN